MNKEITPIQMQYLETIVALNNTQIAKDTFEYFKQLQQENQKQKEMLDILKPYCSIKYDRGFQVFILRIFDFEIVIEKEQYELLKEWKNEN